MGKLLYLLCLLGIAIHYPVNITGELPFPNPR